MHETLSGIIERVTFHNPETGFAVLRVQVRGRAGFDLDPGGQRGRDAQRVGQVVVGVGARLLGLAEPARPRRRTRTMPGRR